jgi:hypothetical protein
MKELLVLAIIATAVSTPALASTDDELKQALIGTWGDSEGCKDGILVFNSDGTFTSGSADDPADVQKGTYTLIGGKLNGEAGDTAMPEVTVTIESGKLTFNGSEPDQKQELVPCPK